jgi:hypothetical protein
MQLYSKKPLVLWMRLLMQVPVEETLDGNRLGTTYIPQDVRILILGWISIPKKTHVLSMAL